MKRCYNFGTDQAASLDSLAKELRIKKTDVLTTGLRLLRTAVREAKRGNCIGIVSGEYVVGELQGPWSDLQPAGVA